MNYFTCVLFFTLSNARCWNKNRSDALLIVKFAIMPISFQLFFDSISHNCFWFGGILLVTMFLSKSIHTHVCLFVCLSVPCFQASISTNSAWSFVFVIQGEKPKETIWYMLLIREDIFYQYLLFHLGTHLANINKFIFSDQWFTLWWMRELEYPLIISKLFQAAY